MNDESALMKFVERMTAIETIVSEMQKSVNKQSETLGKIQGQIESEGKAYLISMHSCQDEMQKRFSQVYQEFGKVYKDIDKERQRTNGLVAKYFFFILGGVVISIVLAVFRHELGI